MCLVDIFPPMKYTNACLLLGWENYILSRILDVSDPKLLGLPRQKESLEGLTAILAANQTVHPLGAVIVEL